MHCLGAGSGGQVSPNGFGSRGSVLSVVRALGVLVCEGRIQGPPRGYKEGPHCVPPLQSAPNNHVCEKDNYLCDRYLVLVREITERVAIGSYLCVEVVLCSDCPCGLVKAKSKHRVLSVPSITSWQHSSEMLLEYWCIGIVPSKSPETMNSQGLYQAVRSRLHFSQVAAWWSRTTGARPSHVATRIVQPSLGDEQLRRFREEPVEHTFPLAGLGDGNSVEVTVWALPRMEDIPRLQCPLHPQQPEDCLVANVVESSAARASTPTGKLISTGPTTSTSPTTTTTTVVPDGVVDGLLMPGKLITKSIAQSSNLHNHHVSFASSNAAVAMPKTMTNNNSSLAAKKQHHQQQQPTFVYYMSSFRSAALLDDRLQIPCDKPGKHHCHCADEEDDVDDVVPATSATVVRPNGERKRRRSLPCRPPDPPTNNGFATSGNNSTPIDHQSLPVVKETSSNITSISTAQNTGGESNGVESLERNFRTQLSIEEQQECCGNLEKRYKRSESTSSTESQKQDGSSQNLDSSSNNTNVPLVIPWISYSANGNTVSAGLPVNQASRNTMNLVLNPFCSERAREKLAAATAEQEKMGKINSKVHHQQTTGKKTTTTTAVKLDDFKKVGSITAAPVTCNRDLNLLMSKLSFSQEKESSTGSKADQSSILDWISRMPGRVLGSNNNNNGELINGKVVNQQPTSRQPKCEVKMRNCNLELSPREFDEVLAVLRARTPLGRRRTALRTAKRREKYDRLVNETTQQQQQQTASKSVQTEVANATVTTDASLYSNVSNKADVLLGAILRSSSKENNIKKAADNSNGTKPKPMLPTKEPIEKSTKTAASSTVTSNSLLESSSTVISPESESSLPSIFNKRLLRLRQLFKLEQDYKLRISEGNECLKKNDFRAKRRIDFSKEERNEDENEDEKKEDDEEEDDENSDILHCDSSIGTSTNSAHVNSIFRSTNNEKCSDCCSPELNAEFIDGQQQHIERYMNGRIITTSGKKKSRSKRNLSPIWVNHNNNHINGKSTNLSENCTTVKEDGTENSQDRTVVPSAKDQERFRRSLENAASMVFHSRTGLPLTSSPAPLRRGSCCFDFDSSLNSVSSKRSALFELNTPPSPGAVSLEENDREMESACDTEEVIRRRSTSRNRPQSHALLGSFEESALNGRLEPVSTVHGFTAEIGASGTFCPKHRKLPVTVFFYTLGDNDKVSSPYLAHINLGKKGYQVPRMGTIQVTLLNPLGTVVKMFVVLYDLSDMPARSHTFLRQRTLRDKTLRYLIHLRFMSGKSGRIYLHTDVRMIICRKSDVDTASDFGSEPPKELRSYIHGPTNPKFSPRC